VNAGVNELQLGAAEALLDALEEAVLVVDDSGTVTFSNPAVERLLGWEPHELRGQPLVTIIPMRLRAAHLHAFAHHIAGGEGRLIGRPVRIAALHRTGAEVDVELLISKGPIADATFGFLRQATDRVDLEAHTSVVHQLLRVVADRLGDGTDAQRVLHAIGDGLGWDVAALWLVERSVRCLRCDAIWSREGVDITRFRTAAMGTLLPVGIGLAGRVWETGESAWEVDFGSHTTSPVEAAAAAGGMSSAFAFPVTAGGSFVGVIELHHRSTRRPDPDLQEAMTSTGRLVGEFLERMWHEEDRRRLLVQLETERARLEALQLRMPSAVLVADAPSGRVVAGNEKLSELVGPPTTAEVDGQTVLEYRFLRGDGVAYDHNDLPFARAARFGDVIDDVEYELAHPDGTTRVVSMSAAPIHDRDGNVVSAVATLHDVTDRRRAGERHRFLADASAALAGSLDYTKGLLAVSRLAVGVLGDLNAVHLADPDGSLRLVAAGFSDRDVAALGQRVQDQTTLNLRSTDGISKVLRSGEPLIYDTVAPEMLEAAAKDDEHLAALLGLGARSAMLIPISAGSQVLGVLSFVSRASNGFFDADAVSLAEDVGRRMAAAVANARLYERERSVASTLQSSLLSEVLPTTPGLEVASRFHPAGEGLEVGGDFYDVFRVGASTVIVVGDVCGKGIEAAALTAQCRFTARAFSDADRDPASVLNLVDSKVQEQALPGDNRFCTAAYVLLQPADTEIRGSASSAGHPLPLIIRTDGTVEEVQCEGSLLFVLGAPSRQTVEFTLRHGDALVLYTDGVTEARGERGWFGEDALRKLASSVAGASADTIAGTIADSAISHGGGRARDDIAVVVAVARS
jgi:PAS domain S-box-containing protein